MLTNTSRWSHARGNEVVPSRWQATLLVPLCCESVTKSGQSGPVR